MGKLSRELRMGIHNRFDIEVVDVETGEVKQKAQAFNVVCNNYFSRILTSGYAIADVIVVGSGSGTPSAADTWLFNYVGSASADSTYSPFDRLDSSEAYDGIWKRQIKRTIPNTQFVGTTITEVGLAYGTSSGQLVTHAMLQDMNGNPISIAHTSTDIISVYCTIYLHYEEQDEDIHLYVGRTTRYYGDSSPQQAIVNRALLFPMSTTTHSSDYPRWFLEWGFLQPLVNSSQERSSSSATITVSNSSLVATFPQIPISNGNIYGIGIVAVVQVSSAYGAVPIITIDAGKSVYAPTLIQNESVGLGDGATTRFKTKFAYPRNAVVKINGLVQNNGVTVRETPPNISWDTGYINEDTTGYRGVWWHWVRVYNEKPTLQNFLTSSPYYAFRKGTTIEMANPEIGVRNFQVASGAVQGSNDGTNWVDIETINSNTQQMNQNGAHYRYYRNVGESDISFIYPNAYDGYNIIFDNPPAQGDVITIDYTTDYIPKDSDHVLDVTLTFTFGEWQGN